MGRRLYVGNLAWTVTDQDLHDVFAEAGEVDSAQVIMDRATNRSRGFGFVEMASADAANKAIESVNGSELGGRTLVVSVARPPQERGEGGFQRQSRGGRGEGRYRDR